MAKPKPNPASQPQPINPPQPPQPVVPLPSIPNPYTGPRPQIDRGERPGESKPVR